MKQSRRLTPSSIASISSRSPPEQIASGRPRHSPRTNSSTPGSALTRFRWIRSIMISLLRAIIARKRLRRERDLVLLEEVAEGPFVVEADQLVVVLVLGQVDPLGREDLAERLKVQRFAVHQHAVEVKQDRRGQRFMRGKLTCAARRGKRSD